MNCITNLLYLFYGDLRKKGRTKMKEKRMLFTGGGTAGHVTVNMALIPVFQHEGYEIDYIGSHDGIERELIGQMANVTYYPISTGKLRRYMSVENIKDPFKVLKGVMQAWRIIGKTKPDIIFSKGGFVSVPVVLAAKLRRVPTIIHESDYTPGLANKLSIPFVNHVLTTFPETLEYVPEKKSTYVGAIVREELFTGSKEVGYTLTSFTKAKPVLLVMGGSSGSEKINTIIRNCLDDILQHFQVVHICGSGQKDGSIQRDGYVQYEYVRDELKDIFAITDYVVSRAGSNAIFEFLALRIPMLLIPLSRAVSRGDQIINAKSFAKQRFAQVIEEESLEEETFVEELKRLKQMGPVIADHMGTYKQSEALEEVVNIIHTHRKQS